MRSCEIRKPHSFDAELEDKHRELRDRKEARKDGQLAAAAGLVQDALDQGRAKPDIEDVVARIEHLEDHCAPNAPHQRVLLWLTDTPPFFRATTSPVREDRGDAE